jgi:sterol desaturase/sphingolipid hydroxylase (fatty acid hydroxylase superfamily)
VEALEHAARVLFAPLASLGAPSARVFLPYLVTSAVLAALVWARARRPHGVSLLGYLFPWRLFLHPSSRFDVKWLFVRAPLRWLVGLPMGALRVAVMLGIFDALRGLQAPELGLSRGAAVALYSVAAFVADDFTRYWVHRWMHRSAALWALHEVHHSAEVLTPLTLYRVHPIEGAINQVRGTVTMAAVTALAMYVLPGRIQVWDILGVEALGFVWNLAGANLRHSHVWLSFGRVAEHVLLSPAQHQIHHGRGTDGTNFGAALAIWDWLGGSLRIAAGTRPPRVGLAEVRYRTVVGGLVGPVVKAWAAVRGTRAVEAPDVPNPGVVNPNG